VKWHHVIFHKGKLVNVEGTVL